MTFDCFSKLDHFIIGELTKIQIKKGSCEKIEVTIRQYSSDKFFTNLLLLAFKCHFLRKSTTVADFDF